MGIELSETRRTMYEQINNINQDSNYKQEPERNSRAERKQKKQKRQKDKKPTTKKSLYCDQSANLCP